MNIRLDYQSGSRSPVPARRILYALLIPLLLSLPGCRGRDELRGRYRGANVLLLVMDTTRADHLGCYGYFRDTTPHIDRFAERSYVFEEAYTSIPVTLPSHASMLTGLYPQRHGALRNSERLHSGLISLADILRDAGYRTGAVVGTAVLQKGTNIEKGFDAYLENWGISDRVPPPTENLPWEFKGLAEDGNRMALEWLREDGEKPFFLMINYYDVHAPYVEIEEFKDLFDPYSPGMEQYFRDHYAQAPEPKWKWQNITFFDRSLAYLDSELGKFLARLEEDGVLENTIVILTSDHGNGLFQHDDYGHHGDQVYEGHIRVALILRLPGAGRGRLRGLVETVDFAPTVLDLLGLSGLEQTDGESFLPLLESEGKGKNLVYAMNVPKGLQDGSTPLQFSVRDSQEKIIHTVNGETLLFQLKQDPSERSGSAIPDDSQSRARVEELLRRGKEWYRLSEVSERLPGELSPDRIRALRALGYL